MNITIPKNVIAEFTGKLLYITGHEDWSMNSRSRTYKEYVAEFENGKLVSCKFIHEDSNDYSAPDHGYGYEGGNDTREHGKSIFDLTEEQWSQNYQPMDDFDAVYHCCTRQNGEHEVHNYFLEGIGEVPDTMLKPLIEQIAS